VLVAGRSVGFVVAFAIPLVLARTLSQDEFGSYRELFLIFSTLYGLAQVGMAESLYYFIPRNPAAAARSIGNALVALSAAGLACVALISMAPGAIGQWLHNEGLEAYLPLLATFLALMLVSSTLEIILICFKRYRVAAAVYAGSDIVKAVLIVVPALLFRSLTALMIGAVGFAALRCVALSGELLRRFGGRLRIDQALLTVQLAYATPFAVAVAVEIVQMNLHQYVVATWFDRATFAVYSVGCLQIPLVELLSTSAANVMMVKMSEDAAQGRSVLGLWHRTVERLAWVFFPLFAMIAMTSHALIVTLFSSRYAAAVPVFVVSSAAIVLSTLPVDAVLRVYARTRTLLTLTILRLAFTAATIAWFISTFSLAGAALVTVLAAAGTKAIAIGCIARLMEVRLRDVLPWRSLGRAAVAAVVPLVPAVMVKTIAGGSTLRAAVLAGTVYGLCYLAFLGWAWIGAHESLWRNVALYPES
jgi:O-antigen/teichoic acid export membrane protein